MTKGTRQNLYQGKFLLCLRKKVFYLERDEEVPREAGDPEYYWNLTLQDPDIEGSSCFYETVPYIKSSPSLRFLYQTVKIFKLPLFMVSSKGNMCGLQLLQLRYRPKPETSGYVLVLYIVSHPALTECKCSVQWLQRGWLYHFQYLYLIDAIRAFLQIKKLTLFTEMSDFRRDLLLYIEWLLKYTFHSVFSHPH